MRFVKYALLKASAQIRLLLENYGLIFVIRRFCNLVNGRLLTNDYLLLLLLLLLKSLLNLFNFNFILFICYKHSHYKLQAIDES